MDVTGARVLVVDDNEINRAILSEQVTSWNFDCAAVSSGKDALNLLDAVLRENLTVDCVLLDYMMPGMNGGDVIKAMHANPATKDIPVIMFTSVQETDDGKLLAARLGRSSES